MSLRNYTNVAPPVQFTADVGSGAALWPVTSTLDYPDTPFTLGAERGTANEEFVLCTDKTSDSFTVERGYDGTTPTDHVTGTSIEHCSGAIDFREANTHHNDRSSHTTVCTSTTRPTTPAVGQRIFETDTCRYYTWTGLGTSAAVGWLPDAGTLLYYGFWASPTALQFSDTAHGLGHDLPIIAQWMMPAIPRLGGAGGVPGVGNYPHRVKIEFFTRSLIFDSGSASEVMLAMLMPASPLSFGGSFEHSQLIATNAPYGAAYQNFCYVSALVDNDRIPPGAAGARLSLYSPTGRTAANAVYWDCPMWMAVTMV
jgi:hypothetical protein